MIHGRVVDRVGNRVRGAHLQGFSSDGQSTWSSEKSNAFGEFQIYLAPGAKYKINAIYTDKGGVRTWAEQVDVTTESTDLRLRLDVVIRE